jgi:oligopeptide transport system substrate-binding protein
MLFGGIAYLDKNLVPQLDLVSSYRISDDSKTYTFCLRDCFWSDGSPITAADFEESWKAALTPAYSSANTNLFYFIKNAKKAVFGKVSLEQVGIHAIDDKTLVVELEQPNHNFLKILINSIFSPVHKSMRYEKANYNNLISSGPFRLRKYTFQNQIVLEKNPYYWNADQVHLDEIDYYVIKDHATALFMFEKKEVDWLGEPLTRISLDALPDLQSKGFLNWFQGAGTHWLFLNTDKYPLTNTNIRKALALAIDRQKIMQDVMHLNNPSPPLGLIPKILKKEKWHPWFQDNDIQAAKAYFAQGLQELGITAAEFPALTINYSINPLWAKVIQAVQQMWAENLGVRIKSEGIDSQIFIRKYYNHEHQIARLGWIMQFDDPASLLEIFKLKNSQPNYTGWEDSEYIRHADAAYGCSETEKWEHLEAAEKIFFDAMPSIPLTDSMGVYVKQPYVKDVFVNYLYQIDFRFAHIEN